MSRLARCEVFSHDEVAVVHVCCRVVRRCFLMGRDRQSGKNYDHRKDQIEAMLAHFARYFGIDLIAHSILSNHYHLVLRSRPDVVETYRDEEVARRWLMICPLRKDRNDRPAEPTEKELRSITGCPVKLAEVRRRLSDISWWVKLLNQRIGRAANREDNCSGHFWQGRYTATRLLDEASVLACCLYVDLNPIRAAIADSVESQPHTSIARRLQAARQGDNDKPNPPSSRQTPDDVERLTAKDFAAMLSPLKIEESGGEVGAVPNTEGVRCSDKGVLPIGLSDYAALADHLARKHLGGKRGLTPECLPNVLTRIGLLAEELSALVGEFGRLFGPVAGRPASIAVYRGRRTGRRYRVRRRLREVVRPADD